MIDIRIKSIPIEQMRIPGSLGDYWYEDDRGNIDPAGMVLQIRVAEYGNVDWETLIAGHEMREEWLTKRQGLTEPEIQAFDKMWDKEHHGTNEEVGFDPRAPYVTEHTYADAVERMDVAIAGLTMAAYEEATAALYAPKLAVEGHMVPGL
jgi:hypothetical protein